MLNQEPTDDELVKCAQDGDTEAFAILYRRHYAHVYGFLKAYLGWPDGEIRTLVDDVFARAWEKRHKQNKKQKFPGWLRTLAAHLAIDEIRKRKTRESYEQPIEGDGGSCALYALNPAKVVETKEDLKETWEAIWKLPEVERMCLVLSAHDFPLSEIVELVREKLGVKLQKGSVRTYISNARRRLRAKERPFDEERREAL